MKRFVLGDIHGEYEKLKQVLRISGFDYENDLLIQIGDIVDRGDEPFKCMDELLKIKNLILIKGNHDANFIQYVNIGQDFLGHHGANGTAVTIYRWKELTLKQKYYYGENIFNKMIDYHITEDNIIFTHGGFDREKKLEEHESHEFQWDRELIQKAMSCSKGQKLNTLYDFKKIYIGHTPTIYWNILTPIDNGGVVNVDTGSGKGGPLTILNIDSEEYWQSDFDKDLMITYGIIGENKEDSKQREDQGEGEE